MRASGAEERWTGGGGWARWVVRQVDGRMKADAAARHPSVAVLGLVVIVGIVRPSRRHAPRGERREKNDLNWTMKSNGIINCCLCVLYIQARLPADRVNHDHMKYNAS